MPTVLDRDAAAASPRLAAWTTALPSPAAAAACARPVGPADAGAADALRLFAGVLQAPSLRTAAHQLASALALQLDFARVTVALHDDGRTRLVGSADADPGALTGEAAPRRIGAIDEAIEQGTGLAWPAADAADAALLLEHRLLAEAVGAAVCTLPWGRDGRADGALCVERDGGTPISAAERRQLEQLVALAGPALRLLAEAELPWQRRLRRRLARGWTDWRQPQRRGLRRLALAGVLALLALAALPLEHAVGGRARVEGAEQRVLPAPTDGFVKVAHVRPGDRVRAGDALVDLLEGDLRLERERWASQLAQHENAYAAAMARSDRVVASTSVARMGEAQAQLALVDAQLARGRIVAPFDALVVDGDLSRSIGAPVRQGDTLLTLASVGDYRVVVEIDETDIGAVQAGQHGALSLSSLPWGGQPIVVERIVPLARAVEGRNVFEVQARLTAPSDGLRPGLLGRAELVVGRRPPLWGWLGQAADRARLAWWSWLG